MSEVIDVGECRECNLIGDDKCTEYTMCSVTLAEHDAKVKADVLRKLFWKIMNDAELEKNDKGWDMVQLQEVLEFIEQMKGEAE